MVEESSLKINAVPCQLNTTINNLFNSAKETLKENFNAGPEDPTWNDSIKSGIKRKTDEQLPNLTKKQRNENIDPEIERPIDEETFKWATYLKETNSTAVNPKIFKHIVPECMCGFESGMKLEVPNHDYANTYWLATIIAKATPLILVRYEGFHEENENDFWCNTLKDDIHPVGWCARTKHALKPPKAIQHKEKNWYAYLIKNLTGARKASESLFMKKSHPAHYLQAGQYVEMIDPYNPTCYWLAKINEVFSGLLYLQYEGWHDKKGEFCCYHLDENLRAVGHGIKNGLTLYPPQGSPSFTHVQFNQLTEKIVSLSRRSDIAVFRSLFTGVKNLLEHNILYGMKMEAIHPKDPTIICVASVSRVFDKHFILIKIDDLISPQEEIANSFVAHKGCQGLFEVGFCHKNNLTLQQPRGYNGKFTWEGYLKYMKSTSVPPSFFLPKKPLDSHDIDVGMKLEAIDLENKSNISVCTISKMVEDYIWLKIDGDTRNEQIFSVNSTYIFPTGWCHLNGHELQWPRANTLEQKNRISSLRHTATRKNRLEVLRKGKLREKKNDKESNKKDINQKHKSKRFQRGGRRGVSRNRIYDTIPDNSITDTSIAIVCINRLSNDYNTEQSIKESFKLDSQGCLPKQVVTIDDDESDDDDKNLLSEKSKSCAKYEIKDIDYFSFIRVKPKNLTKSEEAMFDKKLQENDGNQGKEMDALLSPNNREKRSLSSVVAMLRASRNQPKSQLLEQYKLSKKTNLTSVANSKPEIVSGEIDARSYMKSGDPITIPGKGDFQVVEKIVTKDGDKNKIILKLGKSQENNNKNQINNNVTFDLTKERNPKTNVKDMATLNNMARSHSGCDEIFRNRCNKVRSMCRDLPTNPLVWSRFHVATFIKKADLAKYANLFVEQEVDGHSFLLLAVQELHHVLGIHLGPAVKIHDYIFTLQQLVNDAYYTSKLDVTLEEQNKDRTNENSKKAVKKNPQTVATNDKENIFQQNLSEEEKVQINDSKVVHWINTCVVPENANRQGSLPQVADDAPYVKDEKKEMSNDAESKVFGKIPDNLRSVAVPEVATHGTGPVLSESSQLRIISGSEVMFLPRYAEGNQQVSYVYPVPYNMYRYPLIQNQTPPPTTSAGAYPVRFITDKLAAKNKKKDKHVDKKSESTDQTLNDDDKRHSLTIRPAGPIPNIGQVRYVIPHIPNQMKQQDEHMLQNLQQKMKHKRIPVDVIPVNEPILNGNQSMIFDKYLKDIDIQLRGEELWNEFHKHNTEMVITRAGRRIFPSLQVSISGMSPKVKYAIILDVVPADNHRYKYEYESSEWLVACDELTPKPEQIYIHPESPTAGSLWMKGVVDFTRCKLTNNVSDKNGHIVVSSMHRYQPRIIVVYWDPMFDMQKHLPKKAYLRNGIRKEFIFPQTKFIAVTAYQNTEITHLKIQSNPFARGFRGNWKKNGKGKNKEKDNSGDEPFSGDDSDDSNHSDEETSKILNLQKKSGGIKRSCTEIDVNKTIEELRKKRLKLEKLAAVQDQSSTAGSSSLKTIHKTRETNHYDNEINDTALPHIKSELVDDDDYQNNHVISHVHQVNDQLPNDSQQTFEPPNTLEQTVQPPNILEQTVQPPNVLEQTVGPLNALEKTVQPLNVLEQTVGPLNALEQTVQPPNVLEQTVQPPNVLEQTLQTEIHINKEEVTKTDNTAMDTADVNTTAVNENDVIKTHESRDYSETRDSGGASN